MAKVGRPKNNGLDRLLLLIWVSYFYNESRRAGTKHSSAITETVAKVRAMFPPMLGERPIQISEAGVRAILALHQSRTEEEAFTVTKSRVTEDDLAPFRVMLTQAETLGYPEKVKKPLREIIEGLSRSNAVLAFGYGPRPKYPRI